MLLICLIVAGCSVSKNPLRKETRQLQKGSIKDDTSYVYALPFENGKAHFLVQGYFGKFSHKERAALDFKMKKGTKVLAAREGVVTRVKEDSDKGVGALSIGNMEIILLFNIQIIQEAATGTYKKMALW